MRSAIRPTVARTGLVLLLLASFALSACGLLESAPRAETERVGLLAEPDANDNNAVAVDLVFVTDAEAEERIQAMTAREWFRLREQVRRDFPNGVEVVSWEVVPGQSLPPRELTDRQSDARAILVFADYLSEGDHRARLSTVEAARIRLLRHSFVLEPYDAEE